MKPLLKWVGGKRSLLPQLIKFLPDMREICSYVEPFVGGGAMFFHLQEEASFGKVVLCDCNKSLINLYRCVKEEPDDLIDFHEWLRAGYMWLHSDEKRCSAYHSIRDRFTGAKGVEQAGYLLFLNKTCFNGLFRVNKDGHFNTSFGKYKRPSFATPEDIARASFFLTHAVLINCDFEECKDMADSYTFFYLDPPYIPVRATAKREYYTKDFFGLEDQRRVASMLEVYDRAGAKFMLSMSDTPLSREIYGKWKIDVVEASRRIAGKVSSRGKVSEIVVRNYE